MWKQKKIDEFYKTTHSIAVKNVIKTILMTLFLTTCCQTCTALRSSARRRQALASS